MDGEILFALILATVSFLLVSSLAAPDIVALTGLIAITVFGFIQPHEAFSGFSSATVVTMVAMFFVAAGLRTTGVTEAIAVGICKYMGKQQWLIVTVVMILGALVSAGMNNVAAVAVTLPSVMLIAQRTEIAPAKLLMPLTFAVILGGTLTTIGTTTNLVMIDIMEANGLEPFNFLSFTPYGAILLISGILFIALFGVRLIPLRRSGWRRNRSAADFARLYNLTDRIFSLRVPAGSLLSGLSLQQARFGSIFGAQVLAIRRGNQKILYPAPTAILQAEDILVVQGRRERVEALLLFAGVAVEHLTDGSRSKARELSSCKLKIKDPRLLNESLADLHYRECYHVCVVAVENSTQQRVAHLGQHIVREGDVLHLVGSHQAVAGLASFDGFEVLTSSERIESDSNLFLVRLPPNSPLSGISIKAARVGELTGAQVIAIFRSADFIFVNDGSELLDSGDSLVVSGDPEELSRLGLLGSLQLESVEANYPKEVSDMAMAELAIAPRSPVIGKTLVEMDFREKYDFQVMAIWHRGRPRRSNLASIKLEFGDALLVHGPREKLSVLKEDGDFVFLSADDLPPIQIFRASIAIAAFLFITIAAVAEFLPVHIAATVGALMVVLSGGLKMEDAYREVNWRIVFIVAALIPFGLAFSRSGLVDLIASNLLGSLGQYDFWVTIIALTLVTSAISQFTDGVVAVLLLAPLALKLSEQLGGDPRLLLMGVALSASIAFITPFSHKAHLLVMGAGGYRVSDYVRLGLPLTLISFLALWAGLYWIQF